MSFLIENAMLSMAFFVYLYDLIIMEFKLYNNNVLCRCLTPDTKRTESGLEYKNTDDLKIYEIIAISDSLDKSVLDVSVGDHVIAASNGSTFSYNGEDLVIFDIASISGKICY